jgi:ABC-type uncharacterized transport system substrate-binding protein
MSTPLRSLAVAVLACLGFAGSAAAHPHVSVVVRAELVFAPDNKVSAVRHRWTFDEAYSAYAVQGLDANKDGVFSREELADLAKVNAESLSEFDFFTVVKTDGKRQEFTAPRDYWLEHAAGRLTLNFTLPLREAAAVRRTLILDVADPTFFVDFSYTDGAEAVVLTRAPKGCTTQVTRPRKPDMAQSRLGEDYFANANMGLQFASKVIVACP